jgi:hypothetical protein
MLTSRVPAAVDALLAILRAAPGLSAVAVLDGDPSVNFTDKRLIIIGAGGGDSPAVELSQDFASAGARNRDESFTIRCRAESSAGDQEISLQRTRVFELVGEVEIALRATDANPTAPTLGGVVQWAHVTAGDLVQNKTSGGLAVLAFDVTCRARI